MRPSIAIIQPNTLAAIGLSDIIHRMMPGADVCLFSRYADLAQADHADAFFHYFVSAEELLAGASYFLQRQHKTIVSHGPHGAEPEAVRQAQRPTADTSHAASPHPHLTPREREVLKGIVSGFINKEIAAQMGVSVATVITHRNNLTDKLGTRSVAALTIFAVMHGIVQSEELI